MTQKSLVLLFVLSITSVHICAQTLTPNMFDISQAKKGVPIYFETVYTNTRNEPIRIAGASLTGYEPVGEFKWTVKGDTNWIDTILVVPGQQVDLVLRLIEKKDTPTEYYGRFKQIDAEGAEYYLHYDLYSPVPPVWNVSIETPWIDLNALPYKSDTANIILRNTGATTEKVYIRSSLESPFDILKKYNIITIAPFSSAAVPVFFTPREEGRVYRGVSFSRNVNVSYVEGHVTLFGSTRAGDTSGVVAPTPGIEIEDAVIGSSATQDIQFTTTHAETHVVDIALRQGTNVILEPQPLPITINPASPLIVRVRYQPTTTGTIVDTLVVTSSNGSFAISVLRINAVISSVAEFKHTNGAYPNPSSGLVTWSGRPSTIWHIINTVGEIVAIVTSDDQGACSWSTSTSGMYTLVSQRGEEAMRLMIVK